MQALEIAGRPVCRALGLKIFDVDKVLQILGLELAKDMDALEAPNEFALAERLLDAQYLVIRFRNGHHGPRTYLLGRVRPGNTSRRVSERATAEIRRPCDYFPIMTLSALKRWHTQLSSAKRKKQPKT